MTSKITPDHNRFKKIVKGKIKDDMQKYVSNEEFIGKKGNDKIRIKIPRIDIPRFKYGWVGGVGSGDGEPGDPLNSDKRGNEPGSIQGNYDFDTEITVDEMTDLLAEILGLPFLEPKGKRKLTHKKDTLRNVGPVGNRKHFKRSYKEALKRELSTGNYDPNNPVVVPYEKDFRYKTPKIWPQEEFDAAIILMRDGSSSIDEEQRKIITTTNDWLERIIRRIHPKVDVRYLIHAVTAEETDKHTFDYVSEGGGTKISSVFELCLEVMKEYKECNIYPFYYSDGDNYPDDYKKTFQLLETLIPNSNLFCYGEIYSGFFLGKNKGLLHFINRYFYIKKGEAQEMYKKTRLAKIKKKEDIIPTLETFLNKNKVPFYNIG
ncbi:MAG: DUF444 family protein [Nanoarchaeota archaeon]|nr:DUF444 family protein [Nanoarchaeota archaeon]MBU1643970.1 DUF444 family protein [Nanoarchaeota archaeon]MBU1977136.1 DUF444 family protein [Nanoarchaeota archaeon]